MLRRNSHERSADRLSNGRETGSIFGRAVFPSPGRHVTIEFGGAGAGRVVGLLRSVFISICVRPDLQGVSP